MSSEISAEVAKLRAQFQYYSSIYPEYELVIILRQLFSTLDDPKNHEETSLVEQIVEYIKEYLRLIDDEYESGLCSKGQDKNPSETASAHKLNYDKDAKANVDDAVTGSYFTNLFRSKRKGKLKLYSQQRFASSEINKDSRNLDIDTLRHSFDYFDAYRFLNRTDILSIGNQRRGQFGNVIRNFGKAYRGNNQPAIEDNLNTLKELLQPVHILETRQINNVAILYPYIILTGLGHPFLEYTVDVNKGEDDGYRQSFRIESDGRFEISRVKLHAGKNDIYISPRNLPKLLQDNKLNISLLVECKLINILAELHDPVTKNLLNLLPRDEVIRCSGCKTYYEKESWSATGDYCTFCDSDRYWTYKDREFTDLDQWTIKD